MYIDWFSYLFGAIVILVIPMTAVIVWFSTDRDATQYERIEAWQFVTLFATSMLLGYTYFFVRPYGDTWYIAEAPLWTSSVFGIVLGIALGIAKRHIAHRRLQLKQRIARAITSR